MKKSFTWIMPLGGMFIGFLTAMSGSNIFNDEGFIVKNFIILVSIISLWCILIIAIFKQ